MRRHLLARALIVLAACVVASAALAATAHAQNYIVLYKQNAVASDVATKVQNAGGSLVYAYRQIGVAIAKSDSASFRANMLNDSRIDNVSATGGFATKLDDGSGGSLDSTDASGSAGDLPNSPATDTDSLSPLQWDMRQIHAPQAHAITGGSPSVLVGDIDTGIDFTHPDLAANIDVANSANCVSGAPVPGLAAQDDNGHGTHTAGTIAAASNGIGIVGVAPNVKVAAIKSGNAAGFFFPEAVVCGFVWAAEHHVDVTNNSYFADPWEYNCRNDPVQRAIWKAEQRAILYAEHNGVTVVAAEGNDSDDTAHPTFDVTSPDDTTPQERAITNACVIVPVEVPGVIGVTATSSFNQGTNAGQYPDHLKSFYSSFGVGVTEVTAPGGDSRFGTPPFQGPAVGRVLSTWPASLAATCAGAGRRIVEPGTPAGVYCYQQGTSMASPHAAGVAALIISRYGDASTPQNGKMRPNQVAAYLQQTADPQACPTSLPTTNPTNGIAYLAVLGVNSGAVQQCQGGPGSNSWYGNGEVDALNAVTKNSGSH
jgi:lantibiotic leader peptide-processing serine protease